MAPGAAAPQHMAAPSHYLATGLVRVESRYGFDDTVARIRADVAGKGIREFAVVPQSSLAREAGVELRPSTLIIFGNPPLGTQFITANPNAGLDWPVRVLCIRTRMAQCGLSITTFATLSSVTTLPTGARPSPWPTRSSIRSSTASAPRTRQASTDLPCASAAFGSSM